MLPVTHGDRFTRLHILLYTVLLSAISLMPYLIGMSGLIYLAGALLLSGGFLCLAAALFFSSKVSLPSLTFRYSIVYLGLLFLFLVVDHYYPFG